jgi:hypothetical protein
VADGSTEGLQTCTDTCFAGIGGDGTGQLLAPHGIAIAPNGDIYVFERKNRRVQVFDSTGDFSFMFGGGVNQTTGADLCTAGDVEAGDECGAGSSGTGPGEFSIDPVGLTTGGDLLEIDADGTVFVGDRGRIQEFELDGSFQGEISFATLQASDPDFPADKDPGALAIDPATGDLLIVFRFGAGESPRRSSLWRVSQSGAVLPPAPLLSDPAPQLSERAPVDNVAADPEGNVYASVEQFQPPPDEANLLGEPKVLQLAPDGERLDSCCAFRDSRGIAGLATNIVTAAGDADLYVLKIGASEAFVEVRGPAPDKWPPPAVAPTITDQFSAAVTEDSATLQARINPNFWADTRYYLEYGIGKCSEGGCEKVPAPPGNLLGAGIVKTPVKTDGIEIDGLSPNTTYRYRFIASSSGGGPTFGDEQTFTTFGVPSPRPPCPNDTFRLGSAANLADCRAYEMVSPVDKLGGDIVVQVNQLGLPARLNQAAPSGEKVTYSSYRAFGGSEGSGYTSQYMASRSGTGWSNQAISPPREGPPVFGGSSLDSPYKAFLEDLSVGWLRQDTDPLLAAGAVPGYSNLYRRDFPEGYTTITNAQPTNQTGGSYLPEIQGFSADGQRVFFSANGKLTSTASANPVRQVYESFNGTLRLVSVKPNGGANPVDSSVGTSALGIGSSGESRAANVSHAVSDDGSKVYWSDETANEEGKIYVRVDRTKTLAVSAGSGVFWAATPTGSQAIYTENGQLELFDLAAASSTPLASTVLGVVGASEDLTQVYFVATGALAGSATAGQPNLYLYEEGQPLAFVATLSQADVKVNQLSVIAIAPWRRVSRVSDDGGTVVFMSRANLNGTDNLDVESNQPDAEIYRYSAEDDELLCISCNPTGARPSGREFVLNKAPTGYWYAAKLPGWDFQLDPARVIAAGGDRIYFDSFNPLVLADVNGAQDTYQWEAVGNGSCSEGSTDYSAPAGGCVSLISDGKDSHDSEFVDASADGRDVFFVTSASLVPQDPDQVDLYDARVGGGFAPPVVPTPCKGDDCQPQAPPPALPPIDSQGTGPGNPKWPASCKKGFVRKHAKCVRKPCKKGKVRKKGKCVKKRGDSSRQVRGGKK